MAENLPILKVFDFKGKIGEIPLTQNELAMTFASFLREKIAPLVGAEFQAETGTVPVMIVGNGFIFNYIQRNRLMSEVFLNGGHITVMKFHARVSPAYLGNAVEGDEASCPFCSVRYRGQLDNCPSCNATFTSDIRFTLRCLSTFSGEQTRTIPLGKAELEMQFWELLRYRIGPALGFNADSSGTIELRVRGVNSSGLNVSFDYTNRLYTINEHFPEGGVLYVTGNLGGPDSFTGRFMGNAQARGTGDTDCPICLDGSSNMALKGCGHRFHYHCLHRARAIKCPVCRLPINRDDIELIQRYVRNELAMQSRR